MLVTDTLSLPGVELKPREEFFEGNSEGAQFLPRKVKYEDRKECLVLINRARIYER